ncbi:MAG: DUF1353 domain-containing protein, partial [Rhodobacteraceae bacterium]|nr:DUF1353 domain-containing protein [Paracoccaceae bacterium]
MPFLPPVRAGSAAALLCALALAACVPAATDLDAVRLVQEGTECRGAAAESCFFLGAPVAIEDREIRLPGRLLAFRPTARTLHFIDNQRAEWQAPPLTLTDGASVPLLFVPIVGSPDTPEFRNAAALHDAYCGIGNEAGPVYHAETWQRVHRMFYDALVVGGVAPVKAKVMFAAVWLGGPRWGPTDEPLGRQPALLPGGVQRAAMRRAKTYVERNDPPLATLVLYLQGLETDMYRQAAHLDHEAPAAGKDAVNRPPV